MILVYFLGNQNWKVITVKINAKEGESVLTCNNGRRYISLNFDPHAEREQVPKSVWRPAMDQQDPVDLQIEGDLNLLSFGLCL